MRDEETVGPSNRMAVARPVSLGIPLRDGAGRGGLLTRKSREVMEGADAKEWSAFDATLLRTADELHTSRFVSDPTWKATRAAILKRPNGGSHPRCRPITRCWRCTTIQWVCNRGPDCRCCRNE